MDPLIIKLDLNKITYEKGNQIVDKFKKINNVSTFIESAKAYKTTCDIFSPQGEEMLLIQNVLHFEKIELLSCVKNKTSVRLYNYHYNAENDQFNFSKVAFRCSFNDINGLSLYSDTCNYINLIINALYKNMLLVNII